MIKSRIPEPELMTDEEQALAYSNADFSETNELFVEYILDDQNKKIKNVLDLGCGPADVDIYLASRLQKVNILAIDGSAAMINLAKQKVENSKLTKRIQVELGRLPNLNIQQGIYDIIMSKDLIHHLPDPNNLWLEIERLSNDTTIIYVMDLLRPGSVDEAKTIVENVSSNEAEVLKEDFYNSLLAAYTIKEIREQMKRTRIQFEIEKLGDRHFILKGSKNK